MKNSCLVCGNKNLVKYLDLGKTALANSYLKKSELRLPEPKFPLCVFICPKCFLAQLTTLVDRSLIFRNYAYLSSSSPQLEEYFSNYAKDIKKKFPAQSKKFVLEIGSNDGILLKHFKKSGAVILGVDPAKNIAKVANKNGILTLPEFFNLKTAKKVLNKFGKASIISANHALAHTDKLNEIISGVKILLDPKGIFVFEVQYLGDLLKKNEFDNTYHEHTCYFSLSPLKTLLSNWGLAIFDVQSVEAQGGSIRFFASHSPLTFKVSPSVKNLELQEQKQKLRNLKTYQDFSVVPSQIKTELLKKLTRIKKQGKTIVGYGASAKGNTLLQYCKIGPNLIDYIVDETPTKQGKFSPGMKIPILPTETLHTNPPDYVLLLAWNYADSIMKKEKWLKKFGTKFIIPVPKVKVV